MPSKICPLCFQTSKYLHFQKQFQRDFYQCENCELIFTDREQLLAVDEEKSRYDHHQNDHLSEGYEKFLRRIVNQVTQDFHSSHIGLDYGQGPYPMMRKVLSLDGYNNIDGHDPIFSPCPEVFQKSYDYIIICEVIEHIYKPGEEFKQLVNMLNPNGKIYISTGIKTSEIEFKNWHYIKDDTHINLFTEKTFSFLAEIYNLNIEFPGKDLVTFSKK